MRYVNMVAALVMLALAAALNPASAQSFAEGRFDPAIPTLTAVVGHAPGMRITSPDQTYAYLKALADAAREGGLSF